MSGVYEDPPEQRHHDDLTYGKHYTPLLETSIFLSAWSETLAWYWGRARLRRRIRITQGLLREVYRELEEHGRLHAPKRPGPFSPLSEPRDRPLTAPYSPSAERWEKPPKKLTPPPPPPGDPS